MVTTRAAFGGLAGQGMFACCLRQIEMVNLLNAISLRLQKKIVKVSVKRIRNHSDEKEDVRCEASEA